MIAHLARAMTRRRRRRQNLEALGRLSDRQLADVGLRRSELGLIVQRTIDRS